jgi:hypothetical protein
MSRLTTAVLAGVLTAAALPALAQAPAAPPFSTTKVEGTGESGEKVMRR